MNKQSATNLVKSTFENSYDRDRFLNFSRNLFHSFEPATFIYRGNYIPDAYKKQIKTLERIGKYEDKDRNKIDILAVCLNKDNTLERARTLQRNFISWYLNGSRGDIAKDAALVAFYVEGSHDWRLSLVKMEYRLGKSDAGRLKTFTELTPAKRFSFLVGENENTHTAQKQLLPTLIKEDAPPTLSDLEKVFSVEVVTKEFFEKYKQLFLETKEALDKIVKADPQIENDFKDKNIDTVDFTKKLLGQIVFLYFLQKKGWFGVARDENWGSGPKEFLRLLFEKNVIDYDNYFNDILEPLFYEALAIERPDDFYSRFDCKIPFLNGGLFDPLNNYDWVHTDIRLPNHLFSNDKLTKEGDHGTGILDVFDRYNFTVKEDEPLEREVAVDPEMLGKVFENLLEVKDRKSKGTYYTPREIVHYMCQESLVNYLATELEEKAKKEDIETLVQIGEAAVEHDTRVTEIGEETDTYSYKLPESIRNNAKQIDDALASIHVCDPAVGSGAFLVGMMTEIIRVRNTISSYFVDGDRSIYAFKHHAIQHSLYGVDIDPGATEIAKLRLWLSLIVDEQDIKKIKPLPNLDYKIMQGNSLLEEFEGIKLFDEELFTKSVFDNTAQIESLKAKISELSREFVQLYQKGEFTGIKKQQIEAELQKNNKALKRLTDRPKPTIENTGLFDQESEAKEKAKDLKRLQKEFFNTSHKKEKDQIKKRIESLTWELIEATLREQGKESLMTQVEKYKKANIRPFFLWKLNFSDVFEKNNGFDVVIGNPPYGADLTIEEKNIFKQIYRDVHIRTPDTFNYFISKSLQILKTHNGTLSFIVSNNLLFQNEYVKTREIFIENNQIKIILNLGDSVFENAIVPSCVFIISTGLSNDRNFKYADLRTNRLNVNNKFNTYLTEYSLSDLSDTPAYVFGVNGSSIKLLKKIELSSYKIDVIADEMASGISTGGDKIFRVSAQTVEELHLEHELLHKVLIGREMDKYFREDPDYFIIYTTRDTDIKKYPNTLNYLSQHKDKLLERSECKSKILPWFSLNRQRYPDLFNGNKIIFRQTSDCIRATIDGDNYFCLDSLLILKLKKQIELEYKYVLSILNSRLTNFVYSQLTQESGRIFAQVKPKNIRKLFIPKIGLTEQKKYTEIADKILAITIKPDYLNNQEGQKQVRNYEAQIDQLIYELYDLKPEEIAIVEHD